MGRALRAAWSPADATQIALPKVDRRFEGRRVLLLDSGTSAMVSALQHAKGGTVALPAYCCPDVASAAMAAGCRISLYDTDPLSLTPDWDSVRRCLHEGAQVLVVAHLYGRIIDLAPAHELASQHGTVLVEDAAQAAGGSRNGRPAGTQAGIAVFSFGRGKGLNAGGGGALSVDVTGAGVVGEWPALPTPGAYHDVVAVAKVAAAEWLSQPWLYTIPSRVPALALGQTVFHAAHEPAAPTAATQVLIHEALRAEWDELVARRKVEAWYREKLAHVPELLVSASDTSEQSGALRFPIRLPSAVTEQLVRYGVARSYPRTLRDYPDIHPHLVSGTVALPGADHLARTMHTLPTHALLRDDDRYDLVRALISTYSAS